MHIARLLSALGARHSATERLEASRAGMSRGTSRVPRAERRGRLLLLILLVSSVSCVGDRDRLAPPTITMELIDSTVAPGGSIGVRIVAVDRNSDLLSVAARARTTDSAFVQREELFGGFDSVQVRFDVHVAASAQDGDVVEVTGSVINEQLLSRDTVAFAVVRVPPP